MQQHKLGIVTHIASLAEHRPCLQRPALCTLLHHPACRQAMRTLQGDGKAIGVMMVQISGKPDLRCCWGTSCRCGRVRENALAMLSVIGSWGSVET